MHFGSVKLLITWHKVSKERLIFVASLITLVLLVTVSFGTNNKLLRLCNVLSFNVIDLPLTLITVYTSSPKTGSVPFLNNLDILNILIFQINFMLLAK